MIAKIRDYLSTVGIVGFLYACVAKALQTTFLIKSSRPDIKYPFYLRAPSTDIPTCRQIFKDKEYQFDVRRQPQTIIDAGANIGLASLYFANKYPDARIVALEPDENNFQLLVKNTKPYPNITPVKCALWNEDKEISLVDPGYGQWGFMTKDDASATDSKTHKIPALTVPTLMKNFGIAHIDILKIDVEGAEKEIFSDTSSWISKVDSMIVELHEHMKSGSTQSFYDGAKGFDHQWQQYENVFMVRDKGCILKRSA